MNVRIEATEDMHGIMGRLRASSGLLIATLIGGTLGYYIIGQNQWSLLDCLYMSVITLTTVGFAEVLPIANNPVARAFTIGLLFLGMGAVLYFASTVTAFVLDGDLRRVMRDKNMRRRIEKMGNHTIICGTGQTGRHVLKELVMSRAPVVIIDRSREQIEQMMRLHEVELPYIIGDATEDEILLQAGVERCDGVIVTLGDDHTSLLCTISARTLNPTTRIIAQGSNTRSEEKFRRAGADQVVYTSVIGGMRIASEMLRPQVVSFLDVMLREQDRQLRIEEVELREKSPLTGVMLKDAGLRNVGNALVVAILNRKDGTHHYNPLPDFILMEYHTLIVLAELDDIDRVRAYARPA